MFLIKNDDDLLKEYGFSKNDINSLNKEFKEVFIEQINEDYLIYKKDREESIIERDLNRQMEQNFANIFGDARHEPSLFIFLSLKDPDILKQSKFTNDEINIKKISLFKNYIEQE